MTQNMHQQRNNSKET